MFSVLTGRAVSAAARETPETRRAQLAAFARQTPVNSLVTLSTALLTAALLWTVAPRLWVVTWAGLHCFIAVTLYYRWWRFRSRPAPATGTGLRGIRRAKLWALASGLLWGCGSAFLPLVPPTRQLALFIVIGAMAGGASTTLAAVPTAARLFIISSILPVAVYFLLQAEPVYFLLAAMAMVMTLAMLSSTRIVYTALVEQFRAEQNAADSLRRFESSRKEWLEISETTEAFAMFDAEGKLLIWNDNYRGVFSLPERCLFRGALRTDLLRRGSRAVAVESGDVPLESWIERRLDLHRHPDEPLIERLANGRWLRSTARRTDEGNLVAVHMDITELKRTEEVLQQREAELRQSQRLETVGKLAGGVAHDFNNLLTIISGYCGLLSDRLGGEPAMRGHVHEIGKAADRAASLTQQLLAFSRKQVLQPKVLGLNGVVSEMESMLARLIGEDIRLKVELDPGLGRIKADPAQLEQVVMNLVVNARDSMPGGGNITITTANTDLDEEYAGAHVGMEPGAYVELMVSDSGQGMDRETLEHVFEPFFTTKRHGEGTGLGLSTVYGIVRQSGGGIRVFSEPGLGTTFRIHFPRIEEPVEASEAAGRAVDRLGGSETVLVAEDEEGVRLYIRDVLEDAGYTVLEAGDGMSALAVWENHGSSVDLLVTDIVMPGIGGPELHRRIRARSPEMRTLYISGYTDDSGLHQGILEPGTSFLQKPFDVGTLLRKVRSVLDSE